MKNALFKAFCLGVVPFIILVAGIILWKPVLVANEDNQLVGAVIGSLMAMVGLAAGFALLALASKPHS